MCERVDLGGGNFAIVCGGHRRRANCEFCKARQHSRLCDFRADPQSATCDAKICDRCTTRIAGGFDHCPLHAGLSEKAGAAMQFPATREALKKAGYQLEFARPCKKCAKPLEFHRTPADKLMPIEVGDDWLLYSHFETCPFAEEFRRSAPAPEIERQAELFRKSQTERK
jgi:hypothetical protein